MANNTNGYVQGLSTLDVFSFGIVWNYLVGAIGTAMSNDSGPGNALVWGVVAS